VSRSQRHLAGQLAERGYRVDHTVSGLTLACAIDASRYPKGEKVSKEQFDALKIRYDNFHPDWDYSILPIRTA
jgi:hypothetical protein